MIDQAELTSENIIPFIESFFGRITQEQWNFLKVGNPDNATKLLLAELLLNIMGTISCSILRELQNTSIIVSPERVRMALGDTLEKVLLPGSPTKSKDLDQLTGLVVEEVTKTVNSQLSALSPSASSEVTTRTNNPGIIQKMINCICKVFKASANKIKGIFKFRACSRSRAYSQDSSRFSTLSYSCDSSDMSSSGSSSCSSSRRGSTSKSQESSTVSNVVVQSIISTEVNDIIEPFLDEVPDNEYNMLQSELRSEIEKAADETAQSIYEESATEKTFPQQCWTIKEKITWFFTKTFASASLFKIRTWIKKKLNYTKVSNRETIRSFMDNVETVLLQEGKPTGGIENRPLEILKMMPPAKCVALAKQLTDLLYQNAITEMNIQTSVEELESENVPKELRSMHENIRQRVEQFLSLIRWWLNNQADSHTNVVTDALSTPSRISIIGEEAKEEGTPEANRREDDVDEVKEDMYKMYVILFVDKLVTQIYNEACVSTNISNAREKSLYLQERIWAEIRDCEFSFKPEIMKDLDKAIYKELLEEWSSPEMIMISLSLKHTQLEKSIASSLTRHLRKKTGVARFFARFGL